MGINLCSLFSGFALGLKNHLATFLPTQVPPIPEKIPSDCRSFLEFLGPERVVEKGLDGATLNNPQPEIT